MRPAIGVGVHTGSGRDGTGEAVLVVLRPAPTTGAEVVRRAAVTLVGGAGGQVLHRAQGLPPDEAAALVDEAATVARRLAAAAIAELLDAEAGHGVEAAAAAPVDADGTDADAAEAGARLGAGAAVAGPAAAGAAIAEVSDAGADAGGKVVVGVPVAGDVGEVERELGEVLASHRLIHVGEVALFRDALADAAEDAGLAVVRLLDADVAAEARARSAELGALGRNAGRPWRKAEREAATAALLALVEVPVTRTHTPR